MVLCGEAILALLFRIEGLWPSNRGQDARDTQGRDALATRGAIAKRRWTMPPRAQGTSQACYPGMRGIEPGPRNWLCFARFGLAPAAQGDLTDPSPCSLPAETGCVWRGCPSALDRGNARIGFVPLKLDTSNFEVSPDWLCFVEMSFRQGWHGSRAVGVSGVDLGRGLGFRRSRPVLPHLSSIEDVYVVLVLYKRIPALKRNRGKEEVFLSPADGCGKYVVYAQQTPVAE